MEKMLSREVLNYSIKECFVGDIINFNEIIAIQTMRELLENDESYCHCITCIEDTYALAMNSLPPRYIQVTSENKYTRSDSYICDSTVRESIIQAMEKVRATPNH
ncbi:MAG: late competence development ComFB family protein [Pseudomonadales bacterium]